MARRYGPDGKRLWDGKTVDEFTEADAMSFFADTEYRLKEMEQEDLIMSEEKTMTGQTPEQEEMTALPMKLDVTARLIEPKGNLVGFASLKINDCFVIDDFRILQSDKGLFVGMPSKPDRNSTSGYRETARPITKEFRSELTDAVAAAYHAEVDKLQARSASLAGQDKESIQKQLSQGAKQAARDNAARTTPAKDGKTKKAER